MGIKKACTFGGTCSVCSTEYKTGEEVYMQKDGDKWLICKDETCWKQQGGTLDTPKDGKKFTPTKFPIADFPKLVSLAEAQLESFLNKRLEVIKRQEGINAPSDKYQLMSVSEQAIFVESMVRSMVTGCKP